MLLLLAGAGPAVASPTPTAPTSTIRVNWARKPAFEDAVVALSPAGFWRGNETSGTDAWDMVGGNDGTHTGGVTLGATSLCAGDTIADADLTLNGSSGYDTIPDAASLDAGDTFSVMVAFARGATGTKHYLGHKGSTAWGIYVGSDDKVTLEKVGTGAIVASTSTIDTGSHIVIVTKNGSADCQIWLDGVAVTGTVTDRTCASTAAALEFGRSATPDAYFAGVLGDRAVWLSVLTPAQIATVSAAFLQGELGGPFDDITELVTAISPVRSGRNADRSGDITGQVSLRATNRTPSGVRDSTFVPERNLVANASFGSGITDVDDGTGLTGLLDATSTLSWVADAPSGAGAHALRVVTPATVDAGAGEAIEGRFGSGEVVSYGLSAKAESGTPSLQIGMGSAGTPADIDTHTVTLSTSWQDFGPFTWTPSADRSDAAIFWRDHAGAGITVRVSKVRVNRGSSLNAWCDGPTWPMLQPGALGHVMVSSDGTDYPLIAGSIDSYTQSPGDHSAEIKINDAFSDYDVDIDYAPTSKTHHDARGDIIDLAVQRIGDASPNLLYNGSLPVNTAGWVLGGSAARNTSEKAVGTASLEIPGGSRADYHPNTGFAANFTGSLIYQRYACLSFYAKLRGAADNVSAILSVAGGTIAASMTTGTTDGYAALTASWQRFEVAFIVPSGGANGFQLGFTTASADAARGCYVSGVMLSYGLKAPAYADFGAPVGRLTNWLAEGLSSPEADIGWLRGWSNRCTNPEAVTNTTGWSVATDAFVTGAGATIARITAGSYGVAGDFATAFSLTSGGGVSGCWFAATGTFRAGRSYAVTVQAKKVGGANSVIGIGSQGTPADKATEATLSSSLWTTVTVTWTPTADRTDAHFYIIQGSAQFTAVAITTIPRNYARTGFALDEYDTIGAVDDATLGRQVAQVVTFAAIGSGVALDSALYQVSGVSYTFRCLLRAASGTPSVTLGLGDPYDAAAPGTTRTITLSTSWRQCVVRFTAASDHYANGRTITPWIAAAAASATTFLIAQEQLTLGTRIQPHHALEADGLDAADGDLCDLGSHVQSSAYQLLGAANVSLARHWVSALTARPWLRYTTLARQSIAGQAVVATLADVEDVSSATMDRSTTDQEIVVAVTGAAEGAPLVVANASDAIRRRTRKIITASVGSNEWVITAAAARAIADLTLSRYEVARERPTFRVTAGGGAVTAAILLGIQPNDRVRLTAGRLAIASRSLAVLSRSITVDQGGLRIIGTFDSEEWVPD